MDAEFIYRMILLSLSSFLIGTTLVISVRYFFAWRKQHHNWRGLLPLHVFVVTCSYDLLLIYATSDTMIRIGDEGDVILWRGLLLIPAYALGYVAMYSIAQLHRKKRSAVYPK